MKNDLQVVSVTPYFINANKASAAGPLGSVVDAFFVAWKCGNSSYGYNDVTDNLTTLLHEDDVATANWGNWLKHEEGTLQQHD